MTSGVVFFFHCQMLLKGLLLPGSPNATHLSFKCIRPSDCILRIALLFLNICREYQMTVLPEAF